MAARLKYGKLRRLPRRLAGAAAFCIFMAVPCGFQAEEEEARQEPPQEPARDYHAQDEGFRQAAVRPPAGEADAVSFIGMSVAELFGNFGPPDAVYASRGIEVWQDDVVFVYTGVDFYIYRDRVWQVCLEFGAGINKGDPRTVVLWALGEAAQDNETHILAKLRDTSWPLEWRFNIEGGKVSAIYLYRTDY